MNRSIKTTPQGTRDLLFEECTARRAVENKLKRLFIGRGYNEVITPALEFYDMFSSGSAQLPQEQLYKLTDNNGRLLVMRPDNTAPIARLVSTRLGDSPLPIRLFYSQEVFRVTRSFSGRNDEVAQTGIELIGADGYRADLEVISAAISALDDCGAPDFRLELSHIGYFSALMSELPASDDVKSEILYNIERKNYASLDYLLDSLPETMSVVALRRLPRLFGGEEVLSEAESLFPTYDARKSLEYLRKIYSALSQLGLGDKITIDLGLVSRYEYYTGVVFRGYIYGAGKTVLSGGRYNGLLGEYGTDLPAVGLALEVDALAEAMTARGEVPGAAAPDLLVFARSGYEMKALQYAAEKVQSGVICENCVLDDIDEAKRYAAEKGIARIDIVGDDIAAVNLNGEGN